MKTLIGFQKLSRVSNLSEHLRPKLLLVAIFSIAYVAFAFSYSFLGFLHMQTLSALPQFTYSSFAIEILGHFVFGLIATLPFLDFEIVLIGGLCSVLIDSDHFLSAMNFTVAGRPDHSIIFAFASAAFLIVIANRMKLSDSNKLQMGFLGLVVVMNHIAYDIFASKGPATFQLFFPMNFQEIVLPFSDWYVLLFGAIMLSAIGYLASMRIENKRDVPPPAMKARLTNSRLLKREINLVHA